MKVKTLLTLAFAATLLLQVKAQEVPLGDFDKGSLNPFYTWGAPLTIVADPDGTPGDSVALLDQTGGAWSGIASWWNDGDFFSKIDSITVDVYLNAAGAIQFFADNSISGVGNFTQYVDGVPANTWTTYTLKMSDMPGLDYKQFAIQYSIADKIYFDNFKVYGSPTVVDIIVGSENHNTLEAAVIAAGLADAFSPLGSYTVFAPTDDAFLALPAGVLDALLADPTGDLANVLLYHVLEGKVLSTDLSDGMTATTLLGKDISVTISGTDVFINDARVTVADIEAFNGVVHVLDAVLIPPTTVVDIIVGSENHETLEAAILAAELDDDLNLSGPFTVFAPTDAAFAALPEGAVEALLADIPALTSILTYHVVAGKAMSTDLSDGQMIATVNGKEIKVTINDDGIFINEAQVIVADIEADNGVVHVIDAVLLPPVDEAAFPIDFETQTDAQWFVFANGDVIPSDFMVIENPDKSGINTSDKVLQFVVNDNADTYAGAVSESYAPVEFTLSSHVITMMVWKSVISPVGFKLEASTNGGPVTELKVTNTLTNQWEMVTFDFSSLIGYSYEKIVIFPDFPDTRTEGTTVYIDNIERKQSTVVDIVVGSKDHNTLETAVVAAGLVETLQGEGPFTVFAPTDDAFAALPEGTVEALLADIPTLTSILTYHAVAGKAMSTDLSDGQMIATVNGKKIKVTINDDGVFINNAKVVVADIEADNGVVHVIDAVLLPPAEAAFPIDFETETDAEWFVFANGAENPSDFMVIANPDKSGINTSDNVLQFVVNGDAEVYAGAVSESYAPVEFTLSSHVITMMVWKSVISPVGFKLEASTNGGPVTELKVSNTLTNQWEMLSFDFSSLIGYSYDKIVIFPDFPDTRTEGTTVYIDNIERKQSSVVDIVVNSEVHSTLEAAVVAAGLVETLQGEGPFTVFAPTDAAFAALPAGTVEALLADIPALTEILTYHVVAGKAMSTDLTNGQEITTLLGENITVKITNEGVFINNAKVIVADIEAENGVVHVIDAVLLPSTNVFNTKVSGDLFRVYPNPAAGYITFELNMDKAVAGGTLEMIRIDGVLANKVPITGFITTLDLSAYRSGVYYLRYSSGDKFTIKKLVIK